MAAAIRAAAPADVGAMRALMYELAEYEKLTHLFIATDADLHDALFGARPSAEALVAENDGRIVGYALFFHNYSTFLAKPGLYLEDLFVRPKFRGQGTGEALLRRLARIAVERNCGRLEWSVLDWNQRAIDFYKALGAKPLDDWTMFRVTGEALTRLAE